jgi:hypothetical protein
MSSEYSTIVPTATQKGMTKTSSMATVISRTASQRRRPKVASIRIMTGQVAMTIIAAQTIGTRNALTIQSEATISATMNSTPSVSCMRSRRTGNSWFGVGFMAKGQSDGEGGRWHSRRPRVHAL